MVLGLSSWSGTDHNSNLMTKTENPSPKTNEVSALLLAAGRSRRMGAFKPLLPFGNKSVIQTCIDNLRAGGANDIVVVLGHRGDELKEHLKDSQVTFVTNPDPDSEMSASIACGVGQIPQSARAAIIALVDHPAVSPDVVSRLIDGWSSGARLVIPTWQDRGGHPVLVDLSFRDELTSLDSALGLKSLFEAHQDQVKRLAVENSFIARDMDTWEDYRDLHLEVFGELPSEAGP